MSATRRLIWVPIVHSAVDWGSLAETVYQRHIEQIGQEKTQELMGAINAFWRHVAIELDALELDPTRVRLYQDGLPICGYEAKIVAELAARGSPNHRLLEQWMARGATLMGTESPDLLLQELDWNRRALEAAQDKIAMLTLNLEAKELLRNRDGVMVERILRTLSRGEVGILFIGMLHSMAGRFPPDYDVKRLDIVL